MENERSRRNLIVIGCHHRIRGRVLAFIHSLCVAHRLVMMELSLLLMVVRLLVKCIRMCLMSVCPFVVLLDQMLSVVHENAS